MKVLLLTDVSLNVNGGGFQQTLYNIFSWMPPGKLMVVTSVQATKMAKPSPPFDKQVSGYNLEQIPVQQNRLGRFLNGFIQWLNYSYHQQCSRYKKLRASIQSFDADVVVVAPNGPGAVFIYAQLSDMFTGKKCFPYFMDDWLYHSKLKWVGGNIHALVKKLLAENDSWMMISESMGNILSARYEIQPKHILVIHNPVNIQGVAPTTAVEKKNNFVLAYAGALWPMHFDALMVMAKAIQLLQDEVAVKLVIYTGLEFWQWRKEVLVAAGVEYGGHVPYSQIHETLSKADTLLLTSSFTQAMETHSTGSLQTKITDYLKAGRLIIGCGPEYAAGHHFLKTHQCGVCIETNDVEKAAMALKEILEHLDLKQALVQNGYAVLKNEFSFEVVHKKLQQFLVA